jgi:AcrR family transcriptional regulator
MKVAEIAESKSPWRPRRRQRNAGFDVKREAVLLAAARLFVERGFEAASLTALAESLHVTKPTLYYYFKSKEEILVACFERALEDFKRSMEESQDGKRSSRARLELVMRYTAEVLCSDCGRVLATASRYSLSPAAKETIRRRTRNAYRYLEQLLADGVRDGSLAACDTRIAAKAILGALNWAAYWHKDDGALTATQVGEAFAKIFVNGLKAKA